MLILIAAAACNSSGDGNGDGGPCDTATDCEGNQVCAPTTDTCDEDVPCAGHEECGAGGFCGAAGVCEPSRTGSPCASDENCEGSGTCVEGFCGCGGEAYSATNVPPNLLISLDRSNSMISNDVPNTDPVQNRWEVAQDAVAAVVASHGDGIRFGLKLWPGDNQTCSDGADGTCTQRDGAIFIDPADATAAAITSFVNAGATTTCNRGTPITDSLDSLFGDSRLLDTTRPNYVLLITDGRQTCSGDPVQAVTDLRGQNPSVQTFVVGFSGDVDTQQLEDMANAAGTARAGSPAYYQADDAAALAAAFDEIAGTVLSCSYTLGDVPPDPDDLYVYVDGNLITRDPANGWDYDAGTNQVRFFGDACMTLQAGGADALSIVYGCPVVVE